MATDWGGKAATSGATGAAEQARKTPQGRAAERAHLLAMAAFYRERGNEREALSYERQAQAFSA